MKIIKICLIAILILMTINPKNVFAFSAPPDIKATVGFVYIINNNKMVPQGTGFFIGVLNPENKNIGTPYFVTAKHVLQTSDRKNWLPDFFLRMNKKDGIAEYIRIPIITEGEQKTVYTHTDLNVDLAIMPILINRDIFEYNFLFDSMLTTQKDFKDLKIREGTEIFFTGLFAPYTGYEKIYPIVRFGRVALITEEQIEIEKGVKMNVYLIDTGSFGGNSGSPVFFQLGLDSEHNTLIISPTVIKIAGVMSGTYKDLQPLKVFETSETSLAPSSMGIAFVTPAYKLHQVLFGEELTKKRGY